MPLPRDPLWESSPPMLRFWGHTKAPLFNGLESMNDLPTFPEGTKLMYWCWIREPDSEIPGGWYNGIWLWLVDNDGMVLDVVVNPLDRDKEAEDLLLYAFLQRYPRTGP
jgi:hypothetical protein